MFEIIYKGEVIATVNTIKEAQKIQEDLKDDFVYIINTKEEKL